MASLLHDGLVMKMCLLWSDSMSPVRPHNHFCVHATVSVGSGIGDITASEALCVGVLI